MSAPETRQLLYNIDAEEGVLGAVMIDPGRFDEVSYLAPSDFHDLRNAALWQTITDLFGQGVEPDTITISDRLEISGKLEMVGGVSYLTHLLTAPSTSLNAASYARIIKEYAARRQMLTDAQDQARRAYNLNLPIPTEDLHIKPRFVVRTAADALKPQDPLAWLVDGIITRGSLSIFYGEPGGKKTYSLLSLAARASIGASWLDMSTKPCKVLIVDEESGEKRLSLRIGQALRGALADGNAMLSYVSLPQFHINDPRDVDALQTLILDEGAELVIIDALADIMAGDENSKEDVQPVMNSLRKIAETTNAALVVIHHSNKMGGYRGSSAIKAAVDLMVLITSDDGGSFVNFKSEKNRDGLAMSWAARAVWVGDQFYLESAEPAPKVKPLKGSEEYVLDYLSKNGPSELPAIMSAADVCAPDTARAAVYALAKLGRIYRTNQDAPKNAPAVYCLVKSEEGL